MKKTNQKLVIFYGTHNSGKTFLYNLFEKEKNYICFDVFKTHYPLYKEQILDLFGKENAERIGRFIQDGKMAEYEDYIKEIGRLMEQFPEYDFAVKPAHNKWFISRDVLSDKWNDLVEKYTPLKPDNFYHLFAIRHPKMSYVTCYDTKVPVENFLSAWGIYPFLKDAPDIVNIIKVEYVSSDPVMQSLIKNVNVEKTYTQFDMNDYRAQIFQDFDRFKDGLKAIEEKLQSLFELVGYKVEDKNVSMYLKDLYKMAEPNRIKDFNKLELLNNF